MTNYYGMYQSAPPPGMWGGRNLGVPGMNPMGPFQLPGQLQPTMGGAPPVAGGGGGWLGALGRGVSDFTGWGDMEGMERAQLLFGVGGGVADYFERRGEREEEKRRYEQGLEEDRQHRRRMGEALQKAWGR